MRDPELVARAQRAATRLESAWEQWRGMDSRTRLAGPLQSGPSRQVPPDQARDFTAGLAG